MKNNVIKYAVYTGVAICGSIGTMIFMFLVLVWNNTGGNL